MTALAIGRQAEQQALYYLQRQKLILVQRNFRCRGGEIDLIMRDSTTLIFIEVRHRKSTSYGASHETVTVAKQKKIIVTAQFFLQRQRRYENVPCRFDVIALTGDVQAPQIQWIQDAFQT